MIIFFKYHRICLIIYSYSINRSKLWQFDCPITKTILRQILQIKYISFSIEYKYKLRWICWSLTVCYIKKAKSALIKIIIKWCKAISIDYKRSCIYFFWLILRVTITMFQVISHLIIVLALPNSFMLNFLISWFFNHCNVLRLFDLRTRLFT